MKKKFLLQNGLTRKKQITQHAIGYFPSQFETIFSQPTFVLQVLNEQCS